MYTDVKRDLFIRNQNWKKNMYPLPYLRVRYKKFKRNACKGKESD